MGHNHSIRPIAIIVSVILSALFIAACEYTETTKPQPATSDATAKNTGKIAVTTTSEEARKEFLTGRDLAEKLRITDSIQHFDRAISLDPNFALAELNRANVSPLANEFFDHLKKAVSLAPKALMETQRSKKKSSTNSWPHIQTTNVQTSRSATTTSANRSTRRPSPTTNEQRS
jgi:tetratricopeptide (TPR) repeat protein